MDILSQGTEALFVLCLCFVEDLRVVEVPAYGEKGKAKFLEFFQGKLKKRIVIGLEPQMPRGF